MATTAGGWQLPQWLANHLRGASSALASLAASSSGSGGAFGGAAADGLGHGRRLLASPRVLGVGAGVFILGLFLVVSIVICIAGSRSRKPGLVYAASATLFGIVAAVLLGSPKGSRPPPAPQGYDTGLIPLALMGVLLCAGVAAAAAGLFASVVRATVYARPLSYHADVLRQR